MVLRLILGAVLVAMAVGQLASWPDMPDILAAYQLADGLALPLLAALLIAGELLAGGWFLARPRSRAAAPVWVYTAVAVAWAGLAGQAYARGLIVPNCGCFGVYLSQSLELVRAPPGRAVAGVRGGADPRHPEAGAGPQRTIVRAVTVPRRAGP